MHPLTIARRVLRQSQVVAKTSGGRILGYGRRGVKYQKRALVSYLADPVKRYMEGQRLTIFSNDGLAVAWPQVLNNLGYMVDVMDWDDTSTPPEEAYDLVVVHGAKNFATLEPLIKTTPSIYFSSGSYWKFHNEAEDRRLQDFKKSHNLTLPRDRYINESEEAVNQAVQGIICLGNEGTKQTYASFKRVVSLPIAVYSTSAKERNKDYDAGRKHFLFLSGGGNIHKGLDLLLDAFAGLPQYQLHIITSIDPEFGKYYHKLLYETDNIHCYGYQTPLTEAYKNAVRLCDFSIFPSCSEGSPGSVLSSMVEGLIPIVSESAHFDVEPFGMSLPDVSVSTISKSIAEVSAWSAKDIQRRSNQAKAASQTDYTPQLYNARLEKAVRYILDGTEGTI